MTSKSRRNADKDGVSRVLCITKELLYQQTSGVRDELLASGGNECQGAKILFSPRFTLKPSGRWLVTMKFGFYSSLFHVLIGLSYQCPACPANVFGM